MRFLVFCTDFCTGSLRYSYPPEIDGFGLYDEIRKIDMEVKVCFITAYEVNYQALMAVFPGSPRIFPYLI